MKKGSIFLIVLIFVSCSVKRALNHEVSLDEDQYKSDYILSYILSDFLQPRDSHSSLRTKMLDGEFRFEKDVLGISKLNKEKVREELVFFEDILKKKLKYHTPLLDKSSVRFSLQVLHQRLLEKEAQMEPDALLDSVGYKALAYFSDIYTYEDSYYVYVGFYTNEDKLSHLRHPCLGALYESPYIYDEALYEFTMCPSNGAIVFKCSREPSCAKIICNDFSTREFKNEGCP